MKIFACILLLVILSGCTSRECVLAKGFDYEGNENLYCVNCIDGECDRPDLFVPVENPDAEEVYCMKTDDGCQLWAKGLP